MDFLDIVELILIVILAVMILSDLLLAALGKEKVVVDTSAPFKKGEPRHRKRADVPQRGQAVRDHHGRHRAPAAAVRAV